MKKFALRSFLGRVFLPLFVVAGGAAAIALFYFKFSNEQAQDTRYNIVAVVQCCHQNEGLKTSILTELLQLSIDAPTNLYSFNAHQAQKDLLECPIIKKAEIKKIKPGTIYVEYALRKPIAYLTDYNNTAIDEEGTLIPFKPYFTPKNIPELFVGHDNVCVPLWGSKLEEKKAKLAFSLLKSFNDLFEIQCCSLISLDISKAFDPQFGQREIVVTVEERIGKVDLLTYRRILRLSADYYAHQLSNYLTLRKKLNDEVAARDVLMPSLMTLIVDMRIPNLAFIDGVK